MSISIIPMLQSNRSYYANRIIEYRNKIAECERAYESLCAFKGVVSQSQSDFHSINSGKSNALADIACLKRDCLTAQKYYDGMQKILSKAGSQIIGMVYSALLASISTKLSSYSTSAGEYEDSITYCQNRINYIDQQIEDAKKAEELAQMALGGG